MGKFIITAVFTLFCLSSSVLAQNKATLNEKWNKTMENAESYEVYKVIKKAELNDVWKSVQDTVSTYRSELKEERAKIAIQNDTIKGLHSYIAELRGQVEDAQRGTESINFWGAQVNKYTYSTLLWVFLILSLIGSALLYFMFHNSNRITQQHITDNKNLNASFDEYKVGKIEMERKLRREIQTQVNKLEELKKK